MSTGPTTVVVKHTGNRGVVAGLLGCVFGILGIFTFGIIFVPLAAACSLFGLLRGVTGLSISGIGCSLLGAALTVWGFVFSPTLWVLVGAGVLATHTSSTDRPPKPPVIAAGTPRIATPAPAQPILPQRIEPSSREPNPLLAPTVTPAIAPIVIKTGDLIEWSKEQGEQAYSIDGVHIRVTAAQNGIGESPRIEITASDGTATTVFGTMQHGSMSANIRVAHLDPAHSDIDVIFGAYNYGAHCCIDIKILSLIDHSWRMTDMGLWDGDNIPEPKAVSNKVVLTFGDNAFLYSFAPYAMSRMPLRVFQVQNGHVQDISADPDLKSLHLQNMTESRKECSQRGNGACAAYVASAARLGLLPEAWNFMLSNYDKNSDWKLDFCELQSGDKCVRPIRFDSFPPALDWFLRKHGYLPASQASEPPTSGARQTALLCGRSVEYLIARTDTRSPLLGVWTGSWGNASRLCGGLIVQRVRADGLADVLYVYGPNGPASNVPWKQQQRSGLVSPHGDVSFQDDQGSTFVFHLENTGILDAQFIGRSGKLTGLFARLQP